MNGGPASELHRPLACIDTVLSASALPPALASSVPFHDKPKPCSSFGVTNVLSASSTAANATTVQSLPSSTGGSAVASAVVELVAVTRSTAASTSRNPST